ncbi:hypothetical protein C1637_24705 [Chryseobacterium lactis]|uniref:Lipocalin-like domain-containing protein n=1 Tax=Chryseobacterium lactis TaxID=1241981 RepID=A0A3G6RRJ0_CHRLC|nr:hypothetical protein [Chryseobacterium lactis]AZA81930.1 hypothetical protein EG342_08425 [Chryseobacterium lactis]AZB06928.1 hypothetical protein EG341_24540 [Chryseobacterium lactis]PNW10979.1 hypothetical protein C1637_24705 [Chryseobacterium lactis]
MKLNIVIALLSLFLLSCKTHDENKKYTTNDSPTESVRPSDSKFQGEFSEWQGRYNANFEISRIEDDFTFNYSINIVDEKTILITEQINKTKKEVKGLYVDSYTKNKLIIKSKSDSSLEYIINKTGNEFYLAGNTIYLLNPPNDNYSINKIK